MLQKYATFKYRMQHNTVLDRSSKRITTDRLLQVTKFDKCINVSTKFVAGISLIKITNMAVLEYLAYS